MCHLSHASHYSLFYHSNNNLVKGTDHKAPPDVVFSTPLLPRPNIFLSTLFSNTLSLRSSLNVEDEVSHPYEKKRQNYKSAAMFLSLYSWTANWNTKRFFSPNNSKNSLSFICYYFLHECSSDWLGLFPNILNVPDFQTIYYCDIFPHPDPHT
jgi:hypothetical protein